MEIVKKKLQILYVLLEAFFFKLNFTSYSILIRNSLAVVLE